MYKKESFSEYRNKIENFESELSNLNNERNKAADKVNNDKEDNETFVAELHNIDLKIKFKESQIKKIKSDSKKIL